jgi:L-seryl-tRNA(Ser) seleniumtransferase
MKLTKGSVMKKDELKKIPGVDKPEIKKEIEINGEELVKYAIRQTLESERENIQNNKNASSNENLVLAVRFIVRSIAATSLKPMVNATGIILHTNLARAPLGQNVLKELESIITGYSNLEFDLEKGRRGQRNTHISQLLKFVTQAEDAIVVNNNAAAVMLCLKTFAARKEVIISRSELIEIGGSFRIPEIMRASGAKMVEVGTTNRTHLADYENAVTPRTKVILKAHKSNYFIGGFTEEVEIEELVRLAKKHDLLFIYDMGSGLLRKPIGLPLENEPDVRSSLQAGIDLVTFSGDKLLGGPQAGIIAGRKELISKLAKAPMMRTLRVGKLTIAALTAVLRYYLKDEDLLTKIPIFMMLNRDDSERSRLANLLKKELNNYDIECEITYSPAQTGGGTLPQLQLKSKAVMLISADKKFAKRIFSGLLKLDRPILGILREGNLLFDVLTVFEEDILFIAKAVNSIMRKK